MLERKVIVLLVGLFGAMGIVLLVERGTLTAVQGWVAFVVVALLVPTLASLRSKQG